MANSYQLVLVCLSALVMAIWTTGGVAQYSETDEFGDVYINSNMSNITTMAPNTTVTTPSSNMTTMSNVTTRPSNITTDANVTTSVTTPLTTLAPTTPRPASPFSVGTFFGGIALGVVVTVCSALLVRWYLVRKRGQPYRTV